MMVAGNCLCPRQHPAAAVTQDALRNVCAANRPQSVAPLTAARHSLSRRSGGHIFANHRRDDGLDSQWMSPQAASRSQFVTGCGLAKPNGISDRLDSASGQHLQVGLTQRVTPSLNPCQARCRLSVSASRPVFTRCGTAVSDGPAGHPSWPRQRLSGSLPIVDLW